MEKALNATDLKTTKNLVWPLSVNENDPFVEVPLTIKFHASDWTKSIVPTVKKPASETSLFALMDRTYVETGEA